MLTRHVQLLVYFEVQSHPNHSYERGRSSLLLLDSLIRLFSLTTLDADLKVARDSLYTSTAVPPPPVSIPSNAFNAIPSFTGPAQPGFFHSPGANLFSAGTSFTATSSCCQRPSEPIVPDNIALGLSTTPYSPSTTCNCQALTLVHHCPSIRDIAPAWAGTLIWPDHVSEAEFRKEECRRVVWASVMVTASMNSYTAVLEDIENNALWIKDPSNVRVHHRPMRPLLI